MKGKKQLAFAFLLSIMILLILLMYLLNSNSSKDEIVTNQFPSALLEDEKSNSQDVLQKEAIEQFVIVDVKGAVQNPGVYEINPNARVNDVINLAGGMLENANSFSVNLAERVYDEMTIIVLEKGEAPTISEDDQGKKPIRINIATLEEIETLSGIGPSKAEAIIQYREKHGPFKSKEDLLNVTGIGEKTLERISKEIRIP